MEADGSISMLTQEEPSGLYPSIGMLESLVSWNKIGCGGCCSRYISEELGLC